MKKNWLYPDRRILSFLSGKTLRIMKISVFLFFAGIISMYASNSYSQTTRLSLDLREVTVGDVLSNIEDQSEFYFLYSNKLVDVNRKVSLRVKNKPVNNILDHLFAETDVRYIVFDRQIILSPEEMLKKTIEQQNEQPQEIIVTGKVTDEDGNTLPGVNIIVKGTTTGAISDADGNYKIEVEDTDATLVFSFIGYKSQEIPVNNQTTINVALEIETIGLDEVIMIGYGTQSREMLSTAVSKLDMQVLANIPYTNVASALQGNLAGVRVQTRSGQPGAEPLIILRGGTSINNPDGAAPLFIIDGVIRPDMNNLNTDDIESIQVLKDASSTAIYGARGSNGVVIISTKSGKAGPTRVTYRHDFTVGKVGRRLNILGAEDAVYYGRKGLQNSIQFKPAWGIFPDGNSYFGGIANDLTNTTWDSLQELTPENQHKLQEGWKSMPDPLDPSRTLIFSDTDWQDVMHRTAYSKNHSLNVSGGGDRATFNLGLGYLDAMGTAQNTDYKRLTLNLNSTIKVRDNISVFGRIAFSNKEDHLVPKENDYFKNYQILAPTIKRYFEDGTTAPGQSMNFANPDYLLNEVYVTRNNFANTTISLGAKWEITPELSFDPLISLYQTTAYSREFRNKYLNGPNRTDSRRKAKASYSKRFDPQAEGVFTYKKSLNDAHNIEAKAGMSYFSHNTMSLSANGQGAAADLIPTLNSAAEFTGVNGREDQQVIIGYFSRINYNYKLKYLLSLSARYDGASNLGENNKWGFFPGVSLGWNLHNEDFWNQISLGNSLSKLKLRASYGVNGNISGLGLYQAQGTYATGANYVDVGGMINTVVSNQNLQWERSKTVDLGMDLGLFDNRVNMLLDVYKRITDNLLTNLELPYSSGFSSILTNYGSLENKGIEVELNVRVLPPTSDLSWDVSFNAAKVKTIISKLPDNGAENNRVGGTYLWDPEINDYAWKGGLQEGGRVGDMFAWPFDGVWESDEAAANAPYVDQVLYDRYPDNYVILGGDSKWKDSDGNGIIDVRDKVYVGNNYPDFTGGFTNIIGYKNISLNIRMDYTMGHIIRFETGGRLEGNFSGNNALSGTLLDSWEKDGDITDVPKVYFADAHSNLRKPNTRFMQKGDFLCIREVTLSYNLPANIVKKLKMADLRFNVTGSNLYYFTEYEGLNPEQHVYGQVYPNTRSITFGASVTF